MKRFLPIFLGFFGIILNAGTILLDSSESKNYFSTEVDRRDEGLVVKIFYNKHIDQSIFDECIKKHANFAEFPKDEGVQLEWTEVINDRRNFAINHLSLNENCYIKISFEGGFYVKTNVLKLTIVLPLAEKLQDKTVLVTMQCPLIGVPVLDLSRATISLVDGCIIIFVSSKPKSTTQK